MADLLIRPTHSIIHQSFNSKERFSSPLNGDGFGVGWYECSGDDRETPCVFVSVTPAWNNLNLTRLAEKVESPLFFAHVRAASPGLYASEQNCHPFAFAHFLWMHNGTLAGWKFWRRTLLNLLTEELFNSMQGTTDSEGTFYLFLMNLQKLNPSYSLKTSTFTSQQLRAAMEMTINMITTWESELNLGTPSEMNFVVSNGNTVIATRFIDHPTATPVTLYFTSGSRYTCEDGTHKMIQNDRRQHCHIIASEPLNQQEEWIPVPRNHMVLITPQSNLLLYPIKTAGCP